METEFHPVIIFIPESTEREEGTVGWEQSLLLAVTATPSKCASKESSHWQREAWCSARQSVGFSWHSQVCIINCALLRRKWGKLSDLSPHIIQQQTHLLQFKKNQLNYLNALNLTGKNHSHKKLSPLKLQVTSQAQAPNQSVRSRAAFMSAENPNKNRDCSCPPHGREEL